MGSMKRWTLIIEGKNVIQTSTDYWRLIFAGAPERIARLGFGDDYAWSIIWIRGVGDFVRESENRLTGK